MATPSSNLDLRSALNQWIIILPKLLGAISAALIAASILRTLYYKYLPFPLEFGVQFLERFSLNELTFSAWFSSCMLALCSLISASIATLSNQQKDRDTWRWWAASLLLFAMSADETLSIHEMLQGPLRELFNLEGFLYYSWVLAAFPLLAGMLITLGPILLRLPRLISQRLLLAACIYFGGAVGIEMLSGKIGELYPDGGAVPFICGHLEESMELTGLVLGIAALLHCLKWVLADSPKNQTL